MKQRQSYNVAEDATKMTTIQKCWRDSFVGSAVDTSKWDVSVGTGMTVAVAAGELTISAGTVAGSETILTSKETFSIPFWIYAGMRVSQKIAGNSFFMELVSVDQSGNPDGSDAAAWCISGDDSVTTTQASYEVQNGGMSRLRATNVNSSIGVTGYAVWEIEQFRNESRFYTKQIDTIAARVVAYKRDQQIPDPNKLYKVRIRAKNSTAPSTNTDLKLQFLSVEDFAEITAEVTSSRGSNSADQALPVNITTIPVTSIQARDGTYAWQETNTTLAANGTFTGAARDMGPQTSGSSKDYRTVDFCIVTDQAGTVRIEQSRDNVTWRTVASQAVSAQAAVTDPAAIISAKMFMRYARCVFVNGATIQTRFQVDSAFQR